MHDFACHKFRSCKLRVPLLIYINDYDIINVAGFSLKRVRAVLYHPGVPIFPLMWLFLKFKKTQFYFDLSTTTTLA